AKAEANDADRTVLFQFVDRRLHVAQHRLPIGAGDELARIGNLVGGVAGFEIRLLAIEHRRRHRSIAFAGEPVAYRPDVMIDAEDFLNKDNAAFGFAGRIGTIGAELETVRSGQAKMLTQFGPPSMAWSQVIAAGSLSAAPALLNPPWRLGSDAAAYRATTTKSVPSPVSSPRPWSETMSEAPGPIICAIASLTSGGISILASTCAGLCGAGVSMARSSSISRRRTRPCRSRRSSTWRTRLGGSPGKDTTFQRKLERSGPVNSNAVKTCVPSGASGCAIVTGASNSGSKSCRM